MFAICLLLPYVDSVINVKKLLLKSAEKKFF